MHALVAEAMKKAAIVWLTTAGAPAYPVWCLGVDDALYVVTGEGEQPAPGLTEGVAVQISARGDHGGKIVTWTSVPVPVESGSQTWTAVAPQLAAKRLNASGTTDALIARWSAQCVLYRLAPHDEAAATGADAATGSGAAVPRPTPVARRTAKPFRLHKVKRR